MIRIYLKEIKSIDDTTEWGNDELYIMIASVDFKTETKVETSIAPVTLFVPSLDVTLYGQVELDKGDRFVWGGEHIGGKNSSHSNHIRPFYSIEGSFKELTNSNDTIFLVILMENDDERIPEKREAVKVAALSAVGSSIGLSRESQIEKITTSIKAAIRLPIGAPNFDDYLGIKEIKLTTNELKTAQTIIGVRKKIRFKGDGGIFDLTFETQSKIAFDGLKKGFVIRQISSGRLLDSHQNNTKDFSSVTRTEQNNDTQRWILKEKKGFYTMQQKTNNRYLDAHQNSVNDFSVVTRPKQNNDTQQWIITPKGANTYTIQQKSSKRFLDAHQTEENDFSVVTRRNQNNDTQLWTILAE